MSERKRWVAGLVVACLCAVSSAAWAQEPTAPPAPKKTDQSPEEPKTSFSLGYTYMHDSSWSENLMFGFYGSVARRVGTYLSIVGEVGGSYGEYQNTGFMIQRWGFLGGVRLAGGEGDIRPFFQALAGYSRQGGDVGIANGVAIQPGGGVDLVLSERVIARAQADYRYLREDGNNYYQIRVSGGLVWYVGGKKTKTK